ncbi:zinc ribbon domain-containing protein [Elizabethkingia anophelis]|uniref:zinc ribbon domain-containing protein n=1 Tax=Elizabethkingia anophelis TaxID=1117645 RepID=UPI0038915324
MAKKAQEISVEDKLRALYDLQIIDSRLDEIRNTRGELPIEVEDLEIEIEGLNKRAAKFSTEIKDLQDQIKAKKEAGSHAQNLIEKYKSQQDNVRNNKEFEALGKEIEFQELEIQLADKKIREFNAKIDHKNEVLAEVNTKIDELTNHLNFKKNELDGLVSETQKEEEYLLEKSKEFSEKIDDRLLSSYNRIRTSSSNGLAVVGIERGAAKGSYFTIPPQKQLEIAQRKRIIIDEYSGKILVDDELVMEEQEKMKTIINF